MDNKKDKFHFIAIGGIGQSALAKILLEQGFVVSGSDIEDNKYLKRLRELGAKIFIGHNEDNIKSGSRIVVSSAIKKDNPELVRAKELNLDILHRSDMLKILSENCKAFIGFSGTHGKTTTSGMCAYILEKMGQDPSYAIGGIIPDINTNAKSNKDYKKSYFIAELDESDGTISKYAPDILAINNLEADHFDFFTDGLEQIIKTFNKISTNLKTGSKIIINIDNKGNRNFLRQADAKADIITFSLYDKSACYQAKNIKYSKHGSGFDVFKNGKKTGSVKLILPGEHNIYNALCVCVVLLELGFDFSIFAKYFETFSGMGRRFQKVATFGDIEVIDDYAHHPTEIACTLDAVRHYTKNRVVAIFQPHRYTRFKGLWEEFKNAFHNCDLIIVTDVYRAGDEKIDGYDSSDFAYQMKDKKCFYIGGKIKDIGCDVLKYIKEGDRILTFGAGDITKMGEVLKNEYDKTHSI